MNLKATLLGAFFIGTTISAVIVAAPTRANMGTTYLIETSTSQKLWQIFTSGKCPTTRQPRRRTNISRARNNSCPKISR
ncbi:hypothetical protein [Dulcicalothrix desertica]|uniref:hypothetical protein n=1 Tax=Dulcicalothrix desertica TaxID=32056 RepID=UPI000F8D3804|nr:hypothetical protein [Dulcicalothrix desertica]TWH38848.1 hypothetical protein CAL7102_08035 [Dulcicalothrix desertica PCC 7102]